MTFVLPLGLRKLMLPLVAIALGSLSGHLTDPFGGARCRRFDGTIAGNAPLSAASLDLCVDDGGVWGMLRTQGAAGTSLAELRGRQTSRGELHLVQVGTLVSLPNPQWTLCTDDVIELDWHPVTAHLVGRYYSADCDDFGHLELTPRGAGERTRGLLFPWQK